MHDETPRSKRNLILRNIFEYLLFNYFDYVSSFAKSIGKCKSTVGPLLKLEYTEIAKSESYINYLIHLDTKVKLHVKFPDGNLKPTVKVYTEDQRAMYDWLCEVVKAYIEDKGVSINSFLIKNKIGKDRLFLKTVKFKPTGGSIFGFMEEFSRTGIEFYITLDHDAYRLNRFMPSGKITVMSDSNIKEIEEDTSSSEIKDFYNSASDEDLLKMGKGEVFTDSGITVRPFL